MVPWNIFLQLGSPMQRRCFKSLWSSWYFTSEKKREAPSSSSHARSLTRNHLDDQQGAQLGGHTEGWMGRWE